MPAHAATQALPYTLPSQPHTGWYCMVHIQSALAIPTQAFLSILVVLQQAKNKQHIIKSFMVLFLSCYKVVLFAHTNKIELVQNLKIVSLHNNQEFY